MIRFIFYPQWDYPRLEKTLEDMERRGFRLERTILHYWFRFHPCTPKEVRYLYYYQMPNDTAMLDLAHRIRADAQGNLIPQSDGVLFVTIYRITDQSADVALIRAQQRRYMRRVMGSKLFLGLLFLALSILALTASEQGAHLTIWVLFALSAFFSLWYAWGLFRVFRLL